MSFATMRVRSRLLLVLAAAVLVLASGTGLLIHQRSHAPGSALERIQRRFAAADKKALRFRSETGPECPQVRCEFTPSTLRSHQLLIIAPGQEEYIFIDANGRVTRNEKPLGTVQASGCLSESVRERALSVDGEILARGLRSWEVLWMGDAGSRPHARIQRASAIQFSDGFMRQALLNADWRLQQGEAELYRHGGGMPRSERQKRDPSVERAVNPFTVRTRNHALLTFGKKTWREYHAEARFYFGIPRSGNVIDRDSLPTGSNMFVVQGSQTGSQVAFGWRGESAEFVLMKREQSDRPWQILARHGGPRPPLTNWVRIGLQVRTGGIAEGFLDGQKVLQTTLGREVAGPAHILTGKSLVELDDAAAWSLPRPETAAAPYFLKSRQFAGKKNLHDPRQFYQWTQGTTLFQRLRRQINGRTYCSIVTTKPLMGDFQYQSILQDADAGPLPEGRYAFAFTPHTPGSLPTPDSAPEQRHRIHARYSDGMWQILTPSGTPKPTLPALRNLRFSRQVEAGGQVVLQGPQRSYPLFPLPQNQVHMSIERVSEQGRIAFPRPEHHRIRCAHLTNELFETAPTDWSWIHGAFRMDMRWACQDQWNFMACGSPSTSFLVSKRRFSGDQEHEFYMSLRPMMPWDAGDTSWTYDPDNDRHNDFAVLLAHRGFYVRHDLNFAFCSNGRDPLSGYAVIFGGENNSRTMLLRKGRVVAETTRPEDLFPTESSHIAVHWKWWAFHLRKYGERIQVEYNGRLLFDYRDPQPLEGGHIGYWTVRNGFTVARAVSMAAKVSNNPHVLYVQADSPSQWHPLRRDAVHLEQDGKRTRVSANTGAGEMAVRLQFEAPVDLTQTPVLSLPLTLGPDCRINLFLATDSRDALVQISAPLTGIKALLTPRGEKGECFQLSPMSKDRVSRQFSLGRLRPQQGTIRINLLRALRELDGVDAGTKLTSLTLGNASNSNYLKAGNGGNRAGTWYSVGSPAFARE